ncbi:MAG: VirE protein, partial [Bacteroidaceae bacterium]|nr:VirE protein [Bacteroidaceae bacterium]
MSFGIAKNIKSEVRVCTPDLLKQTLDSPQVARICAEIEDALEKYRRGEITKEEYEKIKADLKKELPVLTFHSTFKNGRRKNEDAIPSGLSIYDLDHIENPQGKWAEIEARKEELGILLAHISPSLEGLRLVFVMPQGMSLAEAQAWMSQQLGDAQYDACVKDFARCSFAVPREYVLFLDEDALFTQSSALSFRAEQSEAKNLNTASECIQILRRSAPLNDNRESRLNDKTTGEVNDNTYPETYEEIPYESIVEVLEEQMGGEPEHGSRNNFIFSMACHLRYVCNDDAAWIARILPTYGEAKDKWLGSIKSACNRSQTKSMPRIMKRTLAICKERKEEDELIAQTSELNGPPPMPRRLPP